MGVAHNSVLRFRDIMNSIEVFLAAKAQAVVGASARTHDYGCNFSKTLLASVRETCRFNPGTKEIKRRKANSRIADLSIVPESMAIIMLSEFTRQVVDNAISAGVKNIWMQTSAEDEQASESAWASAINVIDGGL
tara:strand:+ start:28 stop:432 length:405 start_codon:yes stop_codon:yes gene_type:complete